MNKVVNINLGGNAYQLEEPAYDALRAYLASAEAKLAGNPDKDEIVKDLEQAIGTKCDAHLSAHKTVVTLDDMKAALDEMGPVNIADEAGQEGAGSSTADAGKSSESSKRLYQIREGSVIAGVCMGLSVYFNVDVTLVRILFVLFTLLTHGVGIAVYILMMMFVPVARNAKEYQEAAGVPPITAQALMDRARSGYEQVVKNSGQWQTWKHEWSAQRRAWKAQHKAWERAQRKAHQHRIRAEYAYTQHKSFLSELNEFVWSMFGLAVVSFFIWVVYHHVPEVHAFFDWLVALWERGIYALSQAIGDNH